MRPTPRAALDNNEPGIFSSFHHVTLFEQN